MKPPVVVVAGRSFGAGDSQGRLTVFVKAGERRMSDDPLVMRTADQWYQDGRELEWRGEDRRRQEEKTRREQAEAAARDADAAARAAKPRTIAARVNQLWG